MCNNLWKYTWITRLTSVLWNILLQALKVELIFVLTISNLSPTCSRPSFCAAPPSMILVTYMLLSPGMCWFPTPPAILKPSPVCVWVYTWEQLVSFWVVCMTDLFIRQCNRYMMMSEPTFWSFDEFDLNDGLQHWSAAPHIQPDDRASNLQGFDRLTMRNFRHVCIIHPQDAVVYSGGGTVWISDDDYC